MIAATNKSRIGRYAFLLAAFGLCFLIAGCSADARAKRSFKKVVYKEIKQFNKYHQKEVKPKIYISRSSFYRLYKERSSPIVNIRRTNSINTPYMGTLRFDEDTYMTKKSPNQQEAHKNVHFILSSSHKREIVYTYSSGTWKKKESY